LKISLLVILLLVFSSLGAFAQSNYKLEETVKQMTCGDDRVHFLRNVTTVIRKGKEFAVITEPATEILDMDNNRKLKDDPNGKSHISICNNYTLDNMDKYITICQLYDPSFSSFTNAKGFTCDTKEECVQESLTFCLPKNK
jgi:hypothetical protein